MERILAIGVDSLPKEITSVSWEEIEKGKQPNISDYDLVFIDFSYFSHKPREVYLIDRFLNPEKFFEIMSSNINLYLLSALIYDKGYLNQFGWLPPILTVKIVKETGETITALNDSFSDYFSILKNWTFYFEYDPHISSKNPYLFDTKILARNKANRLLGFEVCNLRKIDYDAYMYQTERVQKKYSGAIYFLHTLDESSQKGIFKILELKYGINFSRREPDWVSTVNTIKSLELKKQLKDLFDEKKRVEESLAIKFQEIEKIDYFKKILWEVGTELEKTVKKSLNLIDLYPSDPSKGEDDGIFTFNRQEYMLEIKSGQERGAEFQELGKLITRMGNRKKITEKDCKGVFVMNNYANYPLEERDKPFAKNIVEAAKHNDVILISTEQLFKIISKVLDGQLSKYEAQKDFFSV